MSNTTLSPEKVKEIQLEADAIYPKTGNGIGYQVKNYAYVEGAISEAEKAAHIIAAKDAEIAERNDDVISANASMAHYNALFEQTEAKLTKADAEIERLKSQLQQVPKWVKFSERQPEPNQKVFIGSEDEGLFLNFWYYWPIGFNGNAEAVFVDMNKRGPVSVTEITHWMPIPNEPGITVSDLPGAKKEVNCFGQYIILDESQENLVEQYFPTELPTELPAATLEGLKEKFFSSYRESYTMHATWDKFLPAIQEVIAEASKKDAIAFIQWYMVSDWIYYDKPNERGHNWFNPPHDGQTNDGIYLIYKQQSNGQ